VPGLTSCLFVTEIPLHSFFCFFVVERASFFGALTDLCMKLLAVLNVRKRQSTKTVLLHFLKF